MIKSRTYTKKMIDSEQQFLQSVHDCLNTDDCYLIDQDISIIVNRIIMEKKCTEK